VPTFSRSLFSGPGITSRLPAWAGKFLDELYRHTMRSRIEPLKKIARSLREHRELILNYFRAKKTISSGTVEDLNNKAKVTIGKS
jgi:transposase